MSVSIPSPTNPVSASPVPRKSWILASVGLISIVFAITSIWFGMRDVLEVGGYCAEGGPYVIAQECPQGSEALMLVGFPMLAIGIGLAIFGLLKLGKAAILMLFLAWPALFLSLAWNFWQYGLNPPAGMSSPQIGWLVCGFLFTAMGFPVILLLPKMIGLLDPDRRGPVLAMFALSAVAGVIAGIWFASAVA